MAGAHRVTLRDMALARDKRFAQSTLGEADYAWLHQVVSEGQLLADLAFADIVFWVPNAEGDFEAVAHQRPSSSATLFYRDVVGSAPRAEWKELIDKAHQTATIVDSSAPDWYENTPARLRAVPVGRRGAPGRGVLPRDAGEHAGQPVAVLTRHSNLSESRMPSRLELTFNECANDLFRMLAEGQFPDPDGPSPPARGAPRASDGLIRLDMTGRVTFASPNALSAFSRLGYDKELEGGVLAEATTSLLTGTLIVDESLPLVVSGRAPWRSEIESSGVTVSLRAIPLKSSGKRIGAVVLCRDVTTLRRQERELITKDATIREIHHRVKNNLQTVASLLRIQSRRAVDDKAKDALNQAMRRVAAIAVVHDTLSEGLSQNVDFDTVFDRVSSLAAEVASGTNPVVKPAFSGSFGILPSEYATPLALALTELVTNAVEHGVKGQVGGVVHITAERGSERLRVVVRDNGSGLPDGVVGEGLGTQIVRTLVEGELSGTISWHTTQGEATEVVIDVPLQYLQEKPVTQAVPTV